jgi:dethiobiotin synthase
MNRMMKRAKGFFITGTGTGVGKTYVSRMLSLSFSRHGPVSYMKPVQTGWTKVTAGRLKSPDFDYVAKNNPLVMTDFSNHVPYCFRPACSPHLAARLAKKTISLRRIKQCFDRICEDPGMKKGCVLVEGAGGILVPLGKSVSMIHLAVGLKLPAIVVVSAGLGTLNHTFLTLCALESAGIPIAGVVMNYVHDRDGGFVCRDNARTIKDYIGSTPFLEVKYKGLRSAHTAEFCDELAKRHL